MTPGEALNSYQRCSRVIEKIIQQAWHQWHRIREHTFKKFTYRIFIRKRRKRFFAFKRKEQSTGKTTINIRQGNHHIRATRPYMQAILLHCKTTIFSGWYMQFLVSVIEVMLRIFKPVGREL